MPLANTDSQAAALRIRGASLAGTKSTEGKGSRLWLNQASCPRCPACHTAQTVYTLYPARQGQQS